MDLQGFTNASVLLGSGVYALCFASEVVYVGKAKRLLTRIYSHRSAWERKRKGVRLPPNVKVIPFSSFFVRPCDESDMDRLEREMIAKYKPKHNEMLIPKRRLTLAEIGFVIAVPVQAQAFVRR